jgi:hypothetical protein
MCNRKIIVSIIFCVFKLTLSALCSLPNNGGPKVSELSNSAQSSTRLIFSCYLSNTTYTGPLLTIRRSSDSAELDFYSGIDM